MWHITQQGKYEKKSDNDECHKAETLGNIWIIMKYRGNEEKTERKHEINSYNDNV